MRLFEGAGLRGLGGMDYKGVGPVRRPMLDLQSLEIRNWLKEKNYSWIQDITNRDKEISAIISEAEKLIKPFLQRFESENIPTEDRLMEEPAGTVISDIARIEKCDLIIMGSRGLTNLASLIVGSVTNRVLQTAPCSVLVVR